MNILTKLAHTSRTVATTATTATNILTYSFCFLTAFGLFGPQSGKKYFCQNSTYIIFYAHYNFILQIIGEKVKSMLTNYPTLTNHQFSSHSPTLISWLLLAYTTLFFLLLTSLQFKEQPSVFFSSLGWLKRFLCISFWCPPKFLKFLPFSYQLRRSKVCWITRSKTKHSVYCSELYSFPYLPLDYYINEV